MLPIGFGSSSFREERLQGLPAAALLVLKRDGLKK
jgi:hypothetical protein